MKIYYSVCLGHVSLDIQNEIQELKEENSQLQSRLRTAMASSNSLSEQVKSLKKKNQNPQVSAEVAKNMASLKTQIAGKCKEIRIDLKLKILN